MDYGLLSLMSWFGADGLVPMNLVASGWNEMMIVLINVTVFLQPGFFSCSSLFRLV